MDHQVQWWLLGRLQYSLSRGNCLLRNRLGGIGAQVPDHESEVGDQYYFGAHVPITQDAVHAMAASSLPS